VCLGCEISMHYFSCLGGRGAVSKNSVGKHYVELMFLHLVGSAGHIGHSGASGL
jgi:hypothetical protein